MTTLLILSVATIGMKVPQGHDRVHVNRISLHSFLEALDHRIYLPKGYLLTYYIPRASDFSH